MSPAHIMDNDYSLLTPEIFSKVLFGLSTFHSALALGTVVSQVQEAQENDGNVE